MDKYNATCAFTGAKDNLQMHAHRNENGEMVGWIFVASDIADKIRKGVYDLHVSVATQFNGEDIL